MNFDFTDKYKVKIKMDNYAERVINEFLMKISNSDTALSPARNYIFGKGNIKIWVKISWIVPYLSSKMDVYGQDGETRYLPNGSSVVNEG